MITWLHMIQNKHENTSVNNAMNNKNSQQLVSHCVMHAKKQSSASNLAEITKYKKSKKSGV